MATLVLTVGGGLIGGPAGAAIGAAIGGAIDREILFKPKGREGPRLTELALQTSSYGTPIPKLFGTMRVAGSVIWATDLVEHRSKEGGKGRPTVTNYSYTASFAVGLSARPILGVGRIWADGKLLRGAAGDFKTRTGFRLHRGSETQEADPLIAASEGAGLAPAHRGLAYAVFEDLELGDFGNRIPALTFEVTADAGPVAIRDIAAELGGGLVDGADAVQPLLGFSAHGASVRAVLESLAGAAGGWFAIDDARLGLRCGPGATRILDDAGARRERAGAPARTRTIAPADTAPRSVTLTHHDPARDYQAGLQRAMRAGPGLREARLELPAAVSAATAKTIAAAALARFDLERERRTLSLAWDALDVQPGDRVTITGEPGQWRVETWSLEAMVVTLECLRIGPAPLPADASGGRHLGAPDLALGATLVEAFELPSFDGPTASVPRLAVAAAGTAPGWRSAALLLSTDNGARWNGAGGTALPAILGRILVPPGPASALIEDRRNVLEIELAHAGMVLTDADAAALDAGGNLAMAGDELIQFARAVPLGANRWRLEGLWRGRRATEVAIGTQASGDAFVLIEAETLRLLDLPLDSIGTTARILAQGPGDSTGGVATMAGISGRSVAPPAPVHLGETLAEDGTSTLRWVRRSRAGWRWIDGLDAPLVEEREHYRVEILPASGAARTSETDSPLVTITAAEREAGCRVTVRQTGASGVSPPATLVLPPAGESE